MKKSESVNKMFRHRLIYTKTPTQQHCFVIRIFQQDVSFQNALGHMALIAPTRVHLSGMDQFVIKSAIVRPTKCVI